MKKYLLLVLIAFVSFSAYAQNFSFTEETIEIAEPDASNEDIVGHNEVKNNLGATQEYEWVREEISKPAEWQTAICDINLCYLPNVGTKTFQLQGLQEGRFDVHLYANGVEGEGHVKITITNINDASSTAVADYYFSLGTSSTGDLETRSIQVFPNPAADVLNITDSFNDIAEVSVYNVIGRQIESFNATSNGQYNVSGLNAGLYLVQLIDTKGAIIRTVRMNKN